MLSTIWFHRLFKVLTETCLRCICTWLCAIHSLPNYKLQKKISTLWSMKYEELKEKTDYMRHVAMVRLVTMQPCNYTIERNSQEQFIIEMKNLPKQLYSRVWNWWRWIKRRNIITKTAVSGEHINNKLKLKPESWNGEYWSRRQNENHLHSMFNGHSNTKRLTRTKPNQSYPDAVKIDWNENQRTIFCCIFSSSLSFSFVRFSNSNRNFWVPWLSYSWHFEPQNVI